MYCSYADLLEEIDDEQDLYKERDPNMPPLGSRVKRGRDWQWGDQDKYGPGTVIGHSKNGKDYSFNVKKMISQGTFCTSISNVHNH